MLYCRPASMAACLLLLICTGCNYIHGPLEVTHCEYDETAMDYEDDSVLGYSASTAMDSIATTGETSLEWEDDEPTTLEWTVSDYTDDVRLMTVTTPDDVDEEVCEDQYAVMGATLTLKTEDGGLDDAWDVTLATAGEEEVTVGEGARQNLALDDFNGELEFDVDIETHSLQLVGATITSDAFTGVLYLDGYVELEDGTKENSRQRLAIFRR